jgi:hypothetical protein
MTFQILIVIVLFPNIKTEDISTPVSWTLRQPGVSDETNPEHIANVESSVVDPGLDEVPVSAKPSDYMFPTQGWSTNTIGEGYPGEPDISEYWYDEWPMIQYFPFYSKLKDRHALLEKLMSGYNKHILPYSGNSFFDISINISLIAVGEIDEIEEKMSTVLWLLYQASTCILYK